MQQSSPGDGLITAGNRWLDGRGSYLLVLLLAAAASLLAVAIHGAPVPHIHDEFTYLFAGQTYAGLQLANPSPPSPESFWSPHLLVEPTFASKYPPAQGMFLAVGYWLGDPLIGLLLSGLVAALALHWALRAVVAPVAALATLAAFSFSALYLGAWVRTYMGGLVAFACAALVIGFFLRLRRHRATATAWAALGVGAAGLFLSRPFEGAIVCLLTGLAYLPAVRHSWRGYPVAFRRGAVIAFAPLALAFGLQVNLNQAVTGSPWRMPHAEFQAQYMNQPIFIWQSPQPARKPSELLAAAESALLAQGNWRAHVAQSFDGMRAAAAEVGGLPLPWWIFLGLAFLAWLEWRLLAVLSGFPLLHALSNYLQLHFYFAPVAPIWFLAIGAMLHAVAQPARLRIAAATLTILVPATLALPGLLERPSTHAYRHRHDLLQALSQRPPNLAFVRYDASANPHLAIVYNDPRLRNHTLLVNDLDAAANCRVLAAFPGREIWRVTIEEAGMTAGKVAATDLCTGAAGAARP